MAVAYGGKLKKDNVVAGGWHWVESKKTETFSADDDADMYLKVDQMSKDGTFKERTFPEYTKFTKFRTTFDVFSVMKHGNDEFVLKWGSIGKKNLKTIKADGPLPKGWTMERYFQAGTKNATLEVK